MADQPMSEVSADRKPKMEFIGEFLYCDGVKVMDWQVTEEEINKFVPASHKARFMKAINAKVIPLAKSQNA